MLGLLLRSQRLRRMSICSKERPNGESEAEETIGAQVGWGVGFKAQIECLLLDRRNTSSLIGRNVKVWISIPIWRSKLLEKVIYNGYIHFLTFCLFSATHIYLASALFLHLVILSFLGFLKTFPGFSLLWSNLIDLFHGLSVLFLIHKCQCVS